MILGSNIQVSKMNCGIRPNGMNSRTFEFRSSSLIGLRSVLNAPISPRFSAPRETVWDAVALSCANPGSPNRREVKKWFGICGAKRWD